MPFCDFFKILTPVYQICNMETTTLGSLFKYQFTGIMCCFLVSKHLMPIKILEYTLFITFLLYKLKCIKCRIWNPPTWVLTNVEPTKFGSYLKHEFLSCIGVNSHKGVTL